MHSNEKLIDEFVQSIDDTIVRLGTTTDRNVLSAFRFINRADFVKYYYEYAPENRNWKLIKQEQEENFLSWQEKVLVNKPLVLSLNALGFPDSSSSAPWLMALCLSVLEIQKGDRILEIGTGSGYNAALMAYLSGEDGKVMTIDVNERLVSEANSKLASFDKRVETHLSDGALGYPSEDLYNRIVSTVSYPKVPKSWIHQLAPGGRLILSINGKQGYILSCLLVVDKAEDGKLTSKIYRYDGHVHFMNMADTAPQSNELLRKHIKSSLVAKRSVDGELLHRVMAVFDDNSLMKLRFLLKFPWTYIYDLITISGSTHYAIIDDQTGSMIKLYPIESENRVEIEIYGNTDFWEEFDVFIHNFQHENVNHRKAFNVSLDSEGMITLVD